MKILEAKAVYELNGAFYILDKDAKGFGIGTVLFDYRIGEYVLLETGEDCRKYSYVAPELIAFMKKI